MRGNIKEEVEEKRGDEKRRVPADIQFALTLAAQFSVVNQTAACISLVSYVSKLPQETGKKSNSHSFLSISTSVIIISFGSFIGSCIVLSLSPQNIFCFIVFSCHIV